MLYEVITEHHVGCFAPYTRQRGQLFHASRHSSGMAFDQNLRRGNNVLGFVPVEAGRADDSHQLIQVGSGVRFDASVTLKKHAGHLIDAHIGTLRGEDRRDQQLERVREGQGDARLGVNTLEACVV